jgi:carbon-monoxide dehydrogenase medium subunit
LAPFEFAEPRTLREALGLLAHDDGTVRPFSGGTALMLMMKAGVLRPTRLVSLGRLQLSGIQRGPSGELRVGAMTSLSDLQRSPLVREGWPVIAKTLLRLSNVRVRNVATIGGHLAHADPHMDLPPLLSALGARATIAGPGGERTVLVEEISSGYLENTLARDELITGIEVPALGAARAAYLKCTTRSADDWPALGVAVVLGMQNDTVQKASVVVSAATDKPTRLPAAERILVGSTLDEKTLKRAADAAAGEIEIEGDQHGSGPYKTQLLRVYLGRAIHEACK